jgi:hypothetical protein
MEPRRRQESSEAFEIRQKLREFFDHIGDGIKKIRNRRDGLVYQLYDHIALKATHLKQDLNTTPDQSRNGRIGLHHRGNATCKRTDAIEDYTKSWHAAGEMIVMVQALKCRQCGIVICQRMAGCERPQS